MTTLANSNRISKEDVPRLEEQISDLFGKYRAEWLEEEDELFELFKEPAYFPDLTTPNPCFLVGGRGTGKTTVLRCMAYQGQFALSRYQADSISKWLYYGMYYRIDTNKVTAFKGEELSEDRWVRIFAHYFNLSLCDLVFKFLDWYELHCEESIELGEVACRKIGRTLHFTNAKTNHDLKAQIEDSILDIEGYVNNVADEQRPLLSMQTSPINTLMEAVRKLPQFKKKKLFFLLDEYENFVDYQQRVVNTFIKHSGQLYSFKIGMRELGWRCRTTLQENEQLISPADYRRIDISESLEGGKFKKFALNVCNLRLSRLQANIGTIKDIRNLLPALSADEEAQLLGIDKLIEPIKRKLKQGLPTKDSSKLEGYTPLEIYFLQFRANSQNMPIEDVFYASISNATKWKEQFENYKHALLFSIRKHVSGINKYYSGWDVFTQLASSNIRYLLQLVEKSIIDHLYKERSLTKPISPKVQTEAAQNVGRNYLSELEGLSVHGAHLTKLLLGLGRVFQVMARDIVGHAPEVNQFHLTDTSINDEAFLDLDQERTVKPLLTSAVMHLALIRSTGNKLGDPADTKDYDYMVHPIYSAFFVFSHRRKRKMLLTGSQLLGLVDNPKQTIREILLNHNREEEKMPLPEQLRLFETYYGSS